jgi:uncharacterized protein (TIGR00251 family)
MQHIAIRVRPHARKNRVEKDKDRLNVWVTAVATDGKANQAVIDLLAAWLGVRKSAISIIRGEKSRDKIIRVDD